MRLPKYDILIPTLFVAVVFPAGAGGWWRYFSGYADQAVIPTVQSHAPAEIAAPAVEERRDIVLLAHLTPSGQTSPSRFNGVKSPARPAKLDAWPASPEPLAEGLYADEGPSTE